MGKSSKDKYKLGKEMFLQGKTIEYISKELRISDSRFSKYLRECGIETNKYHKPKFNENIFDIIDTEEKAYWLGFIFADGYIETPKPNMKYTFEICLSCKDKHHLEKFNIFM